MPDLDGLGEEVRRLRIAQGLSPAELAQRGGVRVEDVLMIERGEGALRNTVVNVAVALDASATAFLRMLD